MQQEEPKYACPCFKDFTTIKKEFARPGESTEPTGFCNHMILRKYPQQDANITGSCPYHGNAELCLENHTDVSARLRIELRNHIIGRKTETDYFERLLEKNT